MIRSRARDAGLLSPDAVFGLTGRAGSPATVALACCLASSAFAARLASDHTALARRLLELVLHKRICRLVLTHKDRLLRFGSELIFALCEIQNIEIVIINKGEPPSF